MTSRRDEALTLAEELLTDIELARLPAIDLARKTSRLARLLDDVEALGWLDHELSGYQPDANNRLPGPASESARRSHREFVDEEGKTRFHITHLGQLESAIEAGKIQKAAAADREVSISSANPSQWVVAPPGNTLERSTIRKSIGQQKELMDKVVGALHEYAASRYQELRFGSAVESAFETVRVQVDASIGALVPEALPKLSAAFENVSTENPEHWAAAAATCRRLLQAAADALRPPGPPVDGHEMTEAKYVNRLIDWVNQQATSATQANLVIADLEYLARRVDAVLSGGHKGAHAEVDRFEASRLVTGTYLLLGDILRLTAP